ncbi:GTPase [Marchantia polymorpha subsp. ruderalis]
MAEIRSVAGAGAGAGAGTCSAAKIVAGRFDRRVPRFSAGVSFSRGLSKIARSRAELSPRSLDCRASFSCGGVSRSSLKHAGTGLWSVSSASKSTSTAIGLGDYESSSRVRVELLRVSCVLSDETSSSAVGNRRRERGPKIVNKSDGILELDKDRRVNRLDTLDVDEIETEYSDEIEGWTDSDDGEISEFEGDEEEWWDKEVLEEEEEDGLQTPSTAIVGTTEAVEEDVARFKLRNGREVYGERTYLVGIDRKGAGQRSAFGIKDSLAELAQLADTAGLSVVGSTYQKLDITNPRTYIGMGKVAEIQAAVRAFKVETIIFDDELSPGQLRNLEKAFEGDVRVCDRTALILDIFQQRAATREAALQVELAQCEYQLPRLTRMWTHLERQAGGMVKGMGEKQIEVDKRILRSKISGLKRQLDSVRDHRQQYRDRRAAVPIPVVSLVGYTNAGKSTFLNRLSGADVLAEDRLFATLDPTTRRVQLPSGKECLFTDTVGFIQKLPTQLVAAFRATLEEITDSTILVHMVDISHPMAELQMEAVDNVLDELDVNHIPFLTVWNKIDRAKNASELRAEAAERDDIICLSALTGEGVDSFYDAVERNIKDLLVWVEAVVPYDQGDLISLIHRLGIVDTEEYTEQGTLIRAHVPLALSRKMLHLRQAMT